MHKPEKLTITAAVAVFFLLVATASASAQADAAVASIRAKVNAINKNAPAYRKKTRSVDGISLEGTEATCFTSREGLKKITARMYGETFRATAELFYSGGELIFAFQRVERYDGHFASNPPPKIARSIETRVYYSSGKAIRVLEGKRQLAAGTEEFREADDDARGLSEALTAAAK